VHEKIVAKQLQMMLPIVLQLFKSSQEGNVRWSMAEMGGGA
jgi:hypothetical protein